MKTFYNEEKKIITTFSSEEEKETVYNLIKRHIEMQPMTHRKNQCNWVFVHNLTNHGHGYSVSICEALGVDPNGYSWEQNSTFLIL